MTTPDTAPSTAVEMRVPAEVAFISTLRLTAASLAARCDLTIDDIEDLRLAVDEACALLLPHATSDSTVDIRFGLTAGRLVVDVSVRTDEASEPDRDGFAWTVLEALATSVDVAKQDSHLTITVTKVSEAAAR